MRKTDRLFLMLCLAGWSIGDTVFAGKEGISQRVYGTRGDHSLRADGKFRIPTRRPCFTSRLLSRGWMLRLPVTGRYAQVCLPAAFCLHQISIRACSIGVDDTIRHDFRVTTPICVILRITRTGSPGHSWRTRTPRR
jgi:hypothetical protein